MTKKYLSLALLCSVFVLGGTECQPAGDQLNSWQVLGQEMEAQIDATEADLIRVKDPIQRASIQGKLDKMKEVAHEFNGALSTIVVVDGDEDDVGLALVEGAIAVGAGFIPGLSLMLPFIRTYRKQRNQIFKAVDAGGGVVDPAKAKLTLVENQGAWKALQKHQANGGAA